VSGLEIGLSSCASKCTLCVPPVPALDGICNRLKTWDKMTGFVKACELRAIHVRAYSGSIQNLKMLPKRILSVL